MKRILPEQGFYSPVSGGDVARWTHPATLRYMHASPEFLDKRNRNGAIVGFDPTRPGMALLVRTWKRCALAREYIAPPDSDRSNHRQDEAVLCVLAYRFQQVFGFELVDEEIDIAVHHDVRPELLEATLARLRAQRSTSHGVQSERAATPGEVDPTLARLQASWIVKGSVKKRHPKLVEAAARMRQARWARPLFELRHALKRSGWELRSASWKQGPAAVLRLALREPVRVLATWPARARRVFSRTISRVLTSTAPVSVPQPSAAVMPVAAPSALPAGAPRVAMIAPGKLPIPPQGWGATERVIWNLHKDLARHGFASAVVNAKEPEEIVRQLEAFTPDVIHLHAEKQFEKIEVYLRACPTPVVFTSHDAYAQLLPPMLFEAAKRSAGIIALNPSIREILVKSGFESVFYVPNGVDTTLFGPLAKGRNTVLAVASNQWRKKLPEIARFFLARPEFHLTICGPKTDNVDPAFPVIPRGSNITVLGNQPEAEVARLLGHSEYFVHLCEIEASALVIREAMAAGCKVWTVPYNAQDLENVSLFWDEAVRDPSLGARAREEAVTTLDWSHIVDRTVDVYREVLACWHTREHCSRKDR